MARFTTSTTYHSNPVDDFVAGMQAEDYYRYSAELAFCDELDLEPEMYED